MDFNVDLLADILSSSSSSSSQAYLSQLTTLSLSDLLAEPATLQTQSHHLTSSLTSLTHTSYPTFLALHSTTNALTSSLDSLSSSLDALLTTSLPALEESAAAWRTRTDSVLHDRNKARVVLEQYDKIKDLFDIPLFIDTCVRNGYFSEALSLANHAASLSVGPESPPILASVQAEVKHSIFQMLLSLLATLHEPNRKLPALWKAVNFLRKMDVFGSGQFLHNLYPSVNGMGTNISIDDAVSSEEQLALAFLTGRLTCLTSALEPVARDITRLINNSALAGQLPDSDNKTPAIVSRTITARDKEDIARYLKKYIDLWREGVYDIITQYSTIFLEEQPHHHRWVSKTPPPSSLSPKLSLSQLEYSQSSEPSPQPQPPTHLLPLLTSHLLQKHLLPLLHSTLPLLPISFLTSLLTQLTYCATAFARVGLDFRGILGGMFESAVLHSLSGDITDAGEKWVVLLKTAMGSNENTGKGAKPSTFTSKRPSEWLIVPSLMDSPPAPPPSLSGPAHIPPQILASYPPLAEHTNALLGVLNLLRLLAPRRIMYELLVALQNVLGEGGEVLCKYLKPILGEDATTNGEGGDRERGIAMAVGEVYFCVFVPFLRRALVEGVYGVKDVDEISKEAICGRLEDAVGMWEEMCRTCTSLSRV